MNQTQRNLTHNFVEGSTISFGSFLTYKCIEGHFFDADYHQTEFKVECQNTGFFQYPANDTLWPRCLPTKFCPSHPEKPRSARIHWNKDLEHQAKASFFCWPNFAAKDPKGDLINVMESTCQWNRTWADVDIQCKPSHCPVIPVPTIQSGLIYKPKEETASPNASWLSDMLYYNKSVPLTIPIPADFGKDLILLIDGRFVQSSPIQVMEIKILDVENNSLANFSLNALTEYWTPGSDALGVMLYERTNISAGDAFRFQMRFLPAQNSFEMLLMDGSAPISIPRVDTGEPNGLVTIDGEITLNLAGFTTSPNETRLMVGDELKFACEQGLVFTGNEFVKPELNLKCEASGLVSGAPETWPICARRGAPRIINCVQGDCPTGCLDLIACFGHNYWRHRYWMFSD
ncbi:uncharacterized protein LOC131880313 [Tigriopus californicus]|uniref:uncharacterized protein LOC131880313 n=1 Tax=Tigriopus californicus TaxID=6832 RepID=UPI0027DA9FFD|nr:uncharacterized protein LOC131880313 [Tigriopus californicus]